MSDEGFEFQLERAITGNELVLQYQPRVLVDTGVIRGVEALVRWRHPTRGLLAPGEFLGGTSDALRADIEAWVLREALLRSGVWRRDGIRLGVSVNMSPGLLRDESFLRTFERTLKIQGEPGTMIVEIAASALAADRPRDALDRIRATGVRLALDDVVDVSSLDAAAFIAWDYVKFGRTVVTPAGTDPASARKLRVIADRTASLGVRTVGMGVEDDATLGLLRELGVFLAQGYAIAPALGVGELTEWMARRERAS